MSSSNVTKLAPASDEFKRILYMLQMSLRGTNVRDVHIWRVDNPTLSVKFERRAADSLVLESWVDIKRLPAVNRVQDICQRGFHAPEDGSGLSFHIGTVDLSAVTGDEHEFLLTRVAVGRAYALLEPDAPRRLPEGYDSFYVHSEPAGEAGTAAGGAAGGGGGGGDASSTQYRHEYIVMESAQALPEFVVHCTFSSGDAVLDAPSNAELSLEQKRARFRERVESVKSEVTRALSVLGPTLGDATSEMLNRLTTDYEGALHQSNQPDAMLEERKRAIGSAIRAITDKLEAIKENSDAVYTAICDKMQAALERLEDLTRQKTAVLLAEELELRRQLEQVEWAESFVTVLQDTLQPTAFVEAWSSHLALRSELYAQVGGASSFQAGSAALESVLADLKVIGDVDVVAGSGPIGGGGGGGAGGGGRRGRAGARPPVRFLGGGGGGAGGESGAAAGGGAASRSRGDLDRSFGASGVGPAWSEMLRADMDSTPPRHGAPAAAEAEPEAGELDEFIASHASAAVPEPLARARLEAELATLHHLMDVAASTPAEQRGKTKAAIQRQEVVVERARRQHQAALAQSGLGQAHGGAYAGTPGHGLGTSMAMSPAQPSMMGPPAGLAAAGGGGGGGAGGEREASRSAAGARALSSPASPARDGAASAGAARAKVSRTPASQIQRALARHSLDDEATRRLRSIRLTADEISAIAFADSNVLGPDDAKLLYLALPAITPHFEQTNEFGEVVETVPGMPTPPACRMLFSTRLESPATVQRFADIYAQEGRGEPTVVVVRANGHVFGGYCATPWDFSNEFGGSAHSFLFSVTKRVKVPFVGRVSGPPQPSDSARREQHEREFRERMEQWNDIVARAREEAELNGVVFGDGQIIANPNDWDVSGLYLPTPRMRPFKRVDAARSNGAELRFGITDLVLGSNFTRCSTELESSYGIGLKPGSHEARTFLCDLQEFAADEVEIWAVGEPAVQAEMWNDGGMGAGMEGGMEGDHALGGAGESAEDYGDDVQPYGDHDVDGGR